MSDEAGIPEVSVILTIGLMLLVFGTFVVSWLIMLMTAGFFWRPPLPRKLADQIRLGLSVMFDTRVPVADPASVIRQDAAPIGSRRQGPTIVL